MTGGKDMKKINNTYTLVTNIYLFSRKGKYENNMKTKIVYKKYDK